jgi:transposase
LILTESPDGAAKVDARRQPPAEQQARRAEVIRLHQENTPVMQIVARTGLSWPTVNATIKRWQAGGDAALEAVPRGRRSGMGRKLTEVQEREVRRLIRAKRPWYYDLEDGLWSTDSVRRLIDARLGVQLTVHGAADYLKRWGVGLQNSKKLPRDRCSGEVRAWLDAHPEVLEGVSRDADTSIYWANPVKSLDRELWGGPTTEKRPRLVSVSTGQGKLLWLVMDGQYVAGQQEKFLRALTRHAGRNEVCLIRNVLNDYSSVRDFINVVPPAPQTLE